MKNYKVGDRVWAKEHYNIPKGFYIIRNFTNNGFFIENENGISGSVFILGIHETADSMFEELGYEKSTNSAYAKYHKHNIKITFVNDVNGKMVSGVPAIITPQLHRAIHQKLIELGWIE